MALLQCSQLVDGAERLPFVSVDAALAALRAGELDAAMVPIENSVEGGVSATLDALASGDPLVVVAEDVVPITFVLAACAGVALADIRTVSTHPHAWAQVRAWMGVHLPDVQYLPGASTAAAAEQFATRGLSLTRIESRPNGDRLGDYCFSIDCEGHVHDERVGETLMGLQRVCAQVRFLGSYPRADGVEAHVGRGTGDTEFLQARAWLSGLRNPSP
jgi:prephenate dehydratase